MAFYFIQGKSQSLHDTYKALHDLTPVINLPLSPMTYTLVYFASFSLSSTLFLVHDGHTPVSGLVTGVHPIWTALSLSTHLNTHTHTHTHTESHSDNSVDYPLASFKFLNYYYSIGYNFPGCPILNHSVSYHPKCLIFPSFVISRYHRPNQNQEDLPHFLPSPADSRRTSHSTLLWQLLTGITSLIQKLWTTQAFQDYWN